MHVTTFGTGKVADEVIEAAIREVFDMSPAGIIKTLDLKRPIYRATAAYGHFGRSEFPWEKTDRVEALKKAAGTNVKVTLNPVGVKVKAKVTA